MTSEDYKFLTTLVMGVVGASTALTSLLTWIIYHSVNKRMDDLRQSLINSMDELKEDFKDFKREFKELRESKLLK